MELFVVMRAVNVTSNFQEGMFFRATLASMVLGLFVLFCTHVHANETGDPMALRGEFNKTYNQLLRNPSDVNLTLKYADLAIKLNDYEAAIPPLERLVMLDPSLYRTKLKLGTFYQKLGSKIVARSYFEDVAHESAAPKDVVEQAKLYLQKL
jgi:hypothetical protein